MLDDEVEDEGVLEVEREVCKRWVVALGHCHMESTENGMFEDRTEQDGGLAVGLSRRRVGLSLVEREGVVRGRTCDMHHRRDQRLKKAPWKGRI